MTGDFSYRVDTFGKPLRSRRLDQKEILQNISFFKACGLAALDGRDLGEYIVENGLGRIHGQTVWGLTQPVRKRLAELETEAKAERRGAWGLRK